MQLKINNQVVYDRVGNVLDYKFNHFPELHEEIEVDNEKYLVEEVTKELNKPDMIRVIRKEKFIKESYITPIP